MKARSTWLALGLLLPFALLPALSLLGHHGAFLADPLSELPVKVWGNETYWREGFFGGMIRSIGWPRGGMLNNPDLLGTLVYCMLRPLVGQAWAWNGLVILLIYANMVAAWSLARDLVRDDRAALVAGVGFGLTPLVMVYCVSGAISDMLNLWPYPLALLFGLRALRRPGWGNGIAGGVLAGLGFVTCPYSFVIFAAIAIPLSVILPFARLSEGDSLAIRGWRQVPRGLAALLFGLVLVAGPQAAWTQHIMKSDSSMMSRAQVEATRHAPPWIWLRPEHPDRYTAFLADYVATGKDALITRDAANRYYRAFSPGLLILGLGALGWIGSRGRRVAVAMWILAAAFHAVVSTGPFLPVSQFLAFDAPLNFAWLGLHSLFPGARLILEPFRHAVVVALALSVAAAHGASLLTRRGGWPVAVGLCLAVVAELIWVSPVPVPLPVLVPNTPAFFASLDAIAPKGAVLELPCFDEGSRRFSREHFLRQLVHGRPIPDEVIGFVPGYLTSNQYTASLLHAERPEGALAVEVRDPTAVERDRLALVGDGFGVIVVEPGRYESPRVLAEVRALLAPWGEPRIIDGFLVYPLVAEKSP